MSTVIIYVTMSYSLFGKYLRRKKETADEHGGIF